MAFRGLFFTEADEHLDVFAVDLHETGPSGGDVHWRGAATGESRASFEGLIQIDPGAQQTHTYLQIHSMMLSPKARLDAIPSVLVVADDVSASHGGTVGELDEAAIFYMQSRGLDRPAAVRVIVEGFFEPRDRRARRRAAGRADPRQARRQAGRRARRTSRRMPSAARDSTRTTAARDGGISSLDVRADFPIFARRARRAVQLVYLDSGATSQKPAVVIDALADHLRSAQRERPPRRLRARAGGRRGVRRRARAGRRVRGRAAAERRSSPRTSPRRSTSSPTRGGARTSAPATRC